ncbi:hypothetical protein Rs2_22765 [Raphanus sativus]|nr:hypothetical protein Rs2_22765 [Raphanus sativus]
MAISASSPVLPPPPVPPDLLFLHPSPDPVVYSLLPLLSVEGEQAPLVSPLGAEARALSPASVLTAVPSSLKSSSWVNKAKSVFQPLVKVASPSVSVDGIPSIQAPDSITLVSSTTWKDHLVAFFHGRPPSPAKVFSDLNPIWGKNGNILVKLHSKRSYLIFIPCPIMRQWALDIGFWHSGNCSFTALLWHPSISLSDMKLLHTPVWVLFKKVPVELWSLLGFSTMASAVGFPVHSEYPDIKPYTNGVVKLRVVIELEKPRPSVVRVTDKLGNSVNLPVEFQKIPPKCSACGDFGHLRLRCLQPLKKPSHASKDFPAFTGVMTVDPEAASASSSTPSSPVAAHSPPSDGTIRQKTLVSPSVSPKKVLVRAPASPADPCSQGKKKVSRAKSLPPNLYLGSDYSASSDWHYVAKRSEVAQGNEVSSPGEERNALVTDDKFAEEEELVAAAQAILRDRLAAINSDPQKTLLLIPENMREGSCVRKYIC